MSSIHWSSLARLANRRLRYFGVPAQPNNEEKLRIVFVTCLFHSTCHEEKLVNLI